MNALVFGLRPMRIVDVGPRSMRIAGGFSGVGEAFEEFPCEFEAPRHYRIERRFFAGPVDRFHVTCDVDAQLPGAEVRYVFEAELRARWAWLFRPWIRLMLSRAAVQVERLIRAQPREGEPSWHWSYPQADAVRARIGAFVDKLPSDAQARLETYADVVARLVEHIATAEESDVARMRPYELAGKWSFAPRWVLEACLVATQAGLLHLSWDLICPNCENPSETGAARLADLPARRHCLACDIDLQARFEQNVEATFRPIQSVRQVSRGGLLFWVAAAHAVVDDPMCRRSGRKPFAVDAAQWRTLSLTGRGDHSLMFC